MFTLDRLSVSVTTIALVGLVLGGCASPTDDSVDDVTSTEMVAAQPEENLGASSEAIIGAGPAAAPEYPGLGVAPLGFGFGLGLMQAIAARTAAAVAHTAAVAAATTAATAAVIAATNAAVLGFPAAAPVQDVGPSCGDQAPCLE